MVSVPPLRMLEAMRSVLISLRCPAQGCWLASAGMLLRGSRRPHPDSRDEGKLLVEACPGLSTRSLYTLYTAGLRYCSGTGQLLSVACCWAAGPTCNSASSRLWEVPINWQRELKAFC